MTNFAFECKIALRKVFLDRLAAALARAQRNGLQVAVLLLDFVCAFHRRSKL